MPAKRDASHLSPAAQMRLGARRAEVAERVRLHRLVKKEEEEYLKGSLSDDELRSMLRPSRKAMEAFRAIQEGDTRRNSREVVTAVLKPLEYLLERKGGGGEGKVVGGGRGRGIREGGDLFKKEEDMFRPLETAPGASRASRSHLTQAGVSGQSGVSCQTELVRLGGSQPDHRKRGGAPHFLGLRKILLVSSHSQTKRPLLVYSNPRATHSPVSLLPPSTPPR